MTNKLSGKWLCGAMLTVALAGVSGQAMAGRSLQIVDFFYTDEAHTGNYVGETIYQCGDLPTSFMGQATPYIVEVQTDCSGPAPAQDPTSALPTVFHYCVLVDPAYDAYNCYM